jgi:GNAT superfamily N-acetyltransferase
MQLSARSILPEDFDCICRFPRDREELFFFAPRAPYPLAAEDLRRALRGRLEPTVVVDRNRVVGYANLYGFRSLRHCFVGNVIVHPGWRGRGVGHFLVEHMVDKASADHRIAEVRVSCFEANRPAMRLYAALGFVAYARETRRDWRGRPVPLAHMRRPPAGPGVAPAAGAGG